MDTKLFQSVILSSNDHYEKVTRSVFCLGWERNNQRGANQSVNEVQMSSKDPVKFKQTEEYGNVDGNIVNLGEWS